MAVLVCGLLIFTTQAIFTQTLVNFLAPRAYDGGSGFATGDFNNDGNLDVVSAKADRINLLRGNGSGIFPQPATIVFSCAGFSSTALNQPFAGDFTGDGKMDIAAWVDDAACTGMGLRALMVLPGNGSGGFSAPIYTEVSNFFFSPNKFASADFNGDGRPDLAVGIAFSGTGDKIAVFMNNGNGTFAAPVTYDTGAQADFNLIVGDFNNDNRPEFVFARFPTDLIIMPNNGDGTFAAPQTINTGFAFGAGFAGEFNGDGKLDFIVTRSNNPNPVIQVWLGNGNNTFNVGQTRTLSVINTGIGSILSGDYNNDGKQDMALSLNGRTLILKGNGNGTFDEDELYGVGGGRIFKGDFNNDGWTDLAVAQALGNQSGVLGTSREFAVSLNLQDGKFFTAPWFEIPFGGEEIAVADFNNDGLKDIALTGDSTNGEIALILQDPEASFKESDKQIKPETANRTASFGEGITPRTIVAGDFNGDGKIDVVVAGRAPSGMNENVIVARNDGAGNLTLLTTLTLSGTVTKVITTDFNGDNRPDLAFSQNRETLPTTNPALSVALGNGSGTFAAPVGYLTNAIGNSVAAGDFNGDHRPDLAVTLNTNKVAVLLNNGVGGFSENASYDLPAAPTEVAAADLNGDGKQDLIVANNISFIANTARVSIFNGNGNGTFLAPVNYQTLWLYNQKLAVDDFNGDGKPDVAVTNNGVISVLENNGSGSLTEKSLWASTGALSAIASADLDGDQKPDLITTSAIQGFYSISFLPNISLTALRRPAPFDFDGDGKTDISIFRPSVGEWWYARSFDGQVAAAQFGGSSDRIMPGDYTGDGKTDLAFWRPSTGEWLILRSEDGSYFALPFGTSGDIPVPADYDGDGKTDQAVYRPSSSLWYIRRSSDSGVTIQQFGADGDIPVVADYDGDGKADLTIFRPSNGQWWLNRSTAGVIVHIFGVSTDKPVQGDFTGDGKADAAFFRPSTGFWYILRSEDGSFYSFPFGANGDIPAPGDYDGDGKFDAAVFRPSVATWYIQRTTAGTQIATFGVNGDTPVPSAFVP